MDGDVAYFDPNAAIKLEMCLRAIHNSQILHRHIIASIKSYSSWAYSIFHPLGTVRPPGGALAIHDAGASHHHIVQLREVYPLQQILARPPPAWVCWCYYGPLNLEDHIGGTRSREDNWADNKCEVLRHLKNGILDLTSLLPCTKESLCIVRFSISNSSIGKNVEDICVRGIALTMHAGLLVPLMMVAFVGVVGAPMLACMLSMALVSGMIS